MGEIQDAKTIDLSQYDFLDLGCSSGGSIKFAQSIFNGTRALGVDIDPEKVAKTRNEGYEATVADATDLGVLRGTVRFVIMSHFLEHLPPGPLAALCVKEAVTKARDFVYIQQPWFDSDDYLRRHGLKLYWSDWSGHPNRMHSTEFIEIGKSLLADGKITRCIVWGHGPIVGSADQAIHPLDSPVNQHGWDAVKHGPKTETSFDAGVFREVRVVYLTSAKPEIPEALLERLRPQFILWDQGS